MSKKSFKTLANGVPNFSSSTTLGQNKLEFFIILKGKGAFNEGGANFIKLFTGNLRFEAIG
jgi:hypothetical protein